MMGPAVESYGPEAGPVQTAEEQYILLLHLRQKAHSPQTMRGADRHTDQFCSDPPKFTMFGVNGQP